ncbi:hypothetical protein BKA63DRAFT_592855 [Paraphoma chrysanthemicola]|nr:hypothetical protein BKA63DRAFT_592855 [Paraphoma chrysanthemicola]
MPRPAVKRNRYFQTAILDPNNPAPPIRHRTPRSAKPPPTPARPNGNIAITLNHRTWYLSKALLARHSTYFATLCLKPTCNAIALDNSVDSTAFANFVDYIHSSIYTLNPQVADFHAIHANCTGYLLGQYLGAATYRDAALCALYALFKPRSSINSHAQLSSIRASHVEFVYQHTQVGDALRRLFVDAVASHWSSADAVNVGLSAAGLSTETESDGAEWASWKVVYGLFKVKKEVSSIGNERQGIGEARGGGNEGSGRGDAEAQARESVEDEDWMVVDTDA